MRVVVEAADAGMAVLRTSTICVCKHVCMQTGVYSVGVRACAPLGCPAAGVTIERRLIRLFHDHDPGCLASMFPLPIRRGGSISVWDLAGGGFELLFVTTAARPA